MPLLFTDADGRVTLIHYLPERLSPSRRRLGIKVESLPDYPEHPDTRIAVLRVRNGDAFYDVEPIPPTPEERQEAEAVVRRLVASMVSDGTLGDTEVAGVAAIFPRWQVDLNVEPGEVYLWDGGLIECIQPHTTQPDWTPDVTPALWKVHRTDTGGGPIEWQPGITVEVGETVTYDGKSYTVIQGHTTQAGWQPPNVPALFEVVADASR